MKKARIRTAPLPGAPLTVRTKLAGTLIVLGLLTGIGLAASRPAHTAGGPVPVVVSNVPLSITTVDSPSRQPVQIKEVFDTNGTNHVIYTVPAGKRLVIEAINSFSNVFNDTLSHSITLYSGSGGSNFFEYDLLPTTAPYSAFSQKILIYGEAGENINAFVQTTGNATPAIYVTLTGYLINVP